MIPEPTTSVKENFMNFNELLAAVDDSGANGVPNILWIVLVVLLIVCAIVYLARRHW